MRIRVIKKGERVTGIEFTKIEVTKKLVLQETTEISIKMRKDSENVTRKKIIGRKLVEIKMRDLEVETTNIKIETTNIKIEIKVKVVKE